MADFCKQCSVENFGEDFGELAGLLTKEDSDAGMAVTALCEGCGVIQVNSDGECLTREHAHHVAFVFANERQPKKGT